MKSHNFYILTMIALAILLFPLGSQGASNILVEIGDGCADIGPSSTSPLIVASPANPYTCAGRIKIESLDGINPARVIVTDSGRDVLQFINAKITALETVSDFPITISAVFDSGPDTGPAFAELFYTLRVDGQFVVPAQRLDYIKVKQYVTNPLGSAPRMLGTENKKIVMISGNPMTNQFDLSTVGEWIGAPDDADMSGDRRVEIQTNLKLTANKVMELGAGIEVTTESSAGSRMPKLEPKQKPIRVPASESRPVEPPMQKDAKSDPADNGFELIDPILDDLPPAYISFNTPEKLQLDERVKLQLLLSMSHEIDELNKRIVEEGKKESAIIKVSTVMEAKLNGSDGLVISDAFPAGRQLISSKELTEWIWEIKAIQPGIQTLYLSIIAYIQHGDEKEKRGIRTFEREITVNVTFSRRLFGFIDNNWQWIFTAILVPIGGWLWNRFRNQNQTST